VLENAIFVGPPILSGLLAVAGIFTWQQNLGATPIVWAMFGIAAFVLALWGSLILALGLAGI
jgi:hypothetical protein